MNPRYSLADTSQIVTPALVVFRRIVEENLGEIISISGDVTRLRPHCKTHKMAAVTQIEVDRGIAKHKCATFAEAEMLAEAGGKDIFLAYNLVGPNIQRAVNFRRKFPSVTFSVTADHPAPLAELSQAMSAANLEIDVLLDLDTGQHRTGVPVGQAAIALYQQIVEQPGLLPGGLHLYDGQNHQTQLGERREAVQKCWRQTAGLRDELILRGWPVPRIVAGGTGSFPIYAEIDDPSIELSPGTCVFHDAGYGQMFPDLHFTPAALVLTRVISRPTANRVTLDLGYKACASDPPAGHRLRFPDLPDAEEVLQNEEHLVLKTAQAEQFHPGDELWAIPMHICPTSALHKQAYVAVDGQLTVPWPVTAPDRQLTI